jgi:hypothetical protein
VRVLLCSAGWERRLLEFLELSTVGTVMEDGAVAEEARASRTDDWIRRRRRRAWCGRRRTDCLLILCAHYFIFVFGEDQHSDILAERNTNGGGFLWS